MRHELHDLAHALRIGGEVALADTAQAAAVASEYELLSFLTSNDLWGGAGSIADQAGGAGRSPARRGIEAALVALGRGQLALGVANSRTEMWVDAFEEWARRDV